MYAVFDRERPSRRNPDGGHEDARYGVQTCPEDDAHWDRCEDRRSMQPSEFVNRPFSFDLIRRLPNGATASDFRFVQSGLLRKIPSLFSLQDLPTLIPVPPLSYPNVKSRA